MAALQTIRQLNGPQVVSVKATPFGKPLQIRTNSMEEPRPNRRRLRGTRSQFRAIRSDGEWIAIRSIEDQWKINDEWWRGPELEVERIYFDVVLENNQRLTIFHDLIGDAWFRQAD